MDPTDKPEYSDTRPPIEKGQISDMNALAPGKTYQLYRFGIATVIFEVTNVYKSKEGTLKIDTRQFGNPDIPKHTWTPAELGISPTKNGAWNTRNYIKTYTQDLK